MPFQIGDRAALRDNGIAPAGSCGTIINDYGDGTYDLKVDQMPPPGCEKLAVPVKAICVEVTSCGCP
jgi:hypothetical protein